MAEDEVVPLEGRDRLAREPVADETVTARADRAAIALPLQTVGVDVAEGWVVIQWCCEISVQHRVFT